VTKDQNGHSRFEVLEYDRRANRCFHPMSWLVVVEEAIKESKGSEPVLVQALQVICGVVIPIFAALNVWKVK
jgi:hypothetical protein